jgi:mRNA interferase HicA
VFTAHPHHPLLGLIRQMRNCPKKSSELKRRLASQGATFEPGRGPHLRVHLNGKTSILPMHANDLKKGTAEGIKKQLGLK